MKILGIEFGSTRIKSVLIDENAKVLAKGSYEWENILVDGLWSYSIDEVFKGLRESYKDLIKDYGEPIKHLDSIGISAMMHGYLAFDESDNLLAPFRTWRNTNTQNAANELSKLFKFNIPMRWSVAQYYQSVLDELPHVKNINFLTTLAGYVHYRLTGKKVLGIGDASGMFPIDDNKQYNKDYLKLFDRLLALKGHDVHFVDLLPKVLLAGQDAGKLTKEGALLIDETGTLEEGALFCPPEGDMGTGMVCTNSIKPKTSNASLGTSANFTVILEKNLKKYYPEIDVITTPTGSPAALIHNNTCTSVINDWVNLFNQVLETFDVKVEKGELFEKLFNVSKKSEDDLGNVISYNFKAGEPIAKTSNGAPMVAVKEEGNLSLENFMASQIYSAIGTIALGLEKLSHEGIKIEAVFGHGGYLKTKGVGDVALSAMVKAPVTLMENATEGGAWGIAILALYLFSKKSLDAFLNDLFASSKKTITTASKKDIEKFEYFMSNYKKGLNAECILTKSINA